LEAALPRRITAEQIAQEQSEVRILETADALIIGNLSPRIRALSSRAREKAKAALAPFYEDAWRLEAAVDNSVVVMELNYLCPSTNALYGAIKHAEDVLARWTRTDAVEAKLS